MGVKSSIAIGLFLAALAIVAASGRSAEAGSPKSRLIGSKHDFSVGGGNSVRAVTEDESCVFCHSAHEGTPNTPLWNHAQTTSEFAGYESSTMNSTMSTPTIDDSSKLCLSCHDGTIALGETVNNGNIEFIQSPNPHIDGDSPSNIAASDGYSDDHPVAMVPVTGPEMRRPHPDDAVKLDGSGKVQCATCHDPHVQDNDRITKKFLVKSNERSALCLTCHTPVGWDTSSHHQPPDATDDGRYTAAQGAHTGYTGVANNGCESCHRPHSGGAPERLLKYSEENTCFKCHNGSVADADKNLQADFQNKIYRHPVTTTPSVHDASEGPLSAMHRLPETSPGAERHAECADCHNSHVANSRPAAPPAVEGELAGVTGITASGTGVGTSQFEYEVCFKCHSDSANKPQALDAGGGNGFGRNAQRLADQGNPGRYNTRLEFTSTVSFHPVVTARGLSTGPGGEVPSLRASVLGVGGTPLPGRALTPNSLIYCTDCHNSDSGVNRGVGTGAAGPHASNFEHLLERAYATNVPPATPGGVMGIVPYSPSSYAMCDKCHDVTGSVLQNQSFSGHSEHVVGQGTACATCHDSHGINGGSGAENTSLMNFDLSIVGPDTKSGLLRYRDLGSHHGECYLTCHGVAHSPKTY
jgi:predicted CXXCH cytochrome family protein